LTRMESRAFSFCSSVKSITISRQVGCTNCSVSGVNQSCDRNCGVGIRLPAGGWVCRWMKSADPQSRSGSWRKEFRLGLIAPRLGPGP
jgi:hypothetical protein